MSFSFCRRYLSMHHPDLETQYTCTILRGEDYDGGLGPRCVVSPPPSPPFSSSPCVGRFRITPSDDADNPITAGTATGAWSVVVKAANRVRNRYVLLAWGFYS